MCCKGSFVSNALNDLSEGPNRQSFGLEEPNEQQFGLEEPNEQETERPEESNGQKNSIICIVIYNQITIDLVGLVKFMKGPFKKLPRKGDTFFQLEKVEGQAGMLILVIMHILLYSIVIR